MHSSTSSWRSKMRAKVRMASDGLPVFESISGVRNCVQKVLLICSFMASMFTIFGKDVSLCVGLDTEIAFYIFSVVLFYLAFEWAICCFLISDYIYSMFSIMDLVVIVALCFDFVDYCALVRVSFGFGWWWDQEIARNVGELTILRGCRLAIIAARLLRLLKLNLTKAMEFAGHNSSSPSSAIHMGLSAQYGLHGHEDDHKLFQYIKDKFNFAFYEAENQGKVLHDEFSMMLRNLLDLDLELEEEDLLYRLMTVFGRSQEVKSMEDHISAEKASKTHWSTLRQRLKLASHVKKVLMLDPNFKSNEQGVASILNGEVRGQTNEGHDNAPSLDQQSLSSNPSNPSSKVNRPRKSMDSTSNSTTQTNVRVSKQMKSVSIASAFVGRINANESNDLDSPQLKPTPNIENIEALEAIQNWDVTKPLRNFRMQIATSLLPLESYSLQWGLDLFKKVDPTDKYPALGEEAYFVVKPRQELSKEEFDKKMHEILAVDGNHIFNIWNKYDARLNRSLREADSQRAPRPKHNHQHSSPILSMKMPSLFPRSIRVRTDDEIDSESCTSSPSFQNILSSRSNQRNFSDSSNGCHGSNISLNDQGSSRSNSRSSSDSSSVGNSITDHHWMHGSSKAATVGDEVEMTTRLQSSKQSSRAAVPRTRRAYSDPQNGGSTNKVGKKFHHGGSYFMPRSYRTEPGVIDEKMPGLGSKPRLINILESTNTSMDHDTMSSKSARSPTNSNEEANVSLPATRSKGLHQTTAGDHSAEIQTSGVKKMTEFSMYDGIQGPSDAPPPLVQGSSKAQYPIVSDTDDLVVEAVTTEEESTYKLKSRSNTTASDSFERQQQKAKEFPNREDNKVEIKAGGSSFSTNTTASVKFSSESEWVRSSTPSPSTSKDNVPKVATQETKNGSIISPLSKSDLSCKFITSVVEKVKTQMRIKMKDEILNDSSSAGENSIAGVIGKGSIRAVIIAIVAALFLGPFLHPSNLTCQDSYGDAMYGLLKKQVRKNPNVVYDASGAITESSCLYLKTDESVLRTIEEYKQQFAKPFLLRIDECILYTNDHYKVITNDDNTPNDDSVREYHGEFDINLWQVGYLPCEIGPMGTLSKKDIDSYSTIALFDMAHVDRLAAYKSISFIVIMMVLILIVSLVLYKDVTQLTEFIVYPLSELAREMDRVARFDLTDKKPTDKRQANSHHSFGSIRVGNSSKSLKVAPLLPSLEDGSDLPPDSVPYMMHLAEVGSIQDSFATMKTTIHSFAKYVPQDVVNILVRTKAGMAKLAVEEREVTVLFSDIENFTKICECLGVGDKLLNLMSDYFTAMASIINSTGGCLLEFIGDAVLAVWNAPTPEEMHAVRAVTAALEMHSFLESVAAEWDAKGYPRVRIRCGIHTAKVLVGNLGAPNRMKYGVLGDGVNTASRLEETNKRYGTRTLISANTMKEVNSEIGKARHVSAHVPPTSTNSALIDRFPNTKEFFQTRPVDRVVFKGKTKATTLYEVVGFVPEKNQILSPSSSAHASLSNSIDGEKNFNTSRRLDDSESNRWSQHHQQQRGGSYSNSTVRSVKALEYVHQAKIIIQDTFGSTYNTTSSIPKTSTYFINKQDALETCSVSISPRNGNNTMSPDDTILSSSQDLDINQKDAKMVGIETCALEISLEEFKEQMLETHNIAWNLFLKLDFRRAVKLFTLVDEMQVEIGPRTEPSGQPNDFFEIFEGDKAARLLRDRCEEFIIKPPPSHWDGTEILHDKHF